jgi:hypothetical protein
MTGNYVPHHQNRMAGKGVYLSVSFVHLCIFNRQAIFCPYCRIWLSMPNTQQEISLISPDEVILQCNVSESETILRIC